MTVEQVGTIPLIAFLVKKFKLIELIDEKFKVNGNWQGESLGTITAIYLTYVLDTNKHTISHASDWVSRRVHVLRKCFDAPKLSPFDLDSTRLEAMLDYLSKDEAWYDFESTLNKQFLKVYDTTAEGGLSTIRLDCFNIPSFKQIGELIKDGYTKHRRSDKPQSKGACASLDPLAMPLACIVVPGDSADDKLYLPLITQVKNSLNVTGRLLVGDCKFSSLLNRLEVLRLGAYYLTPFTKVLCTDEILLDLLKQKPQELKKIYTHIPDPKEKGGQIEVLKAEWFELAVQDCRLSKGMIETERHVLVRSEAYRKSQSDAFDKRRSKCESELKEVLISKQGRKHPKDEESARKIAQAVVDKHKMGQFVSFKITTTLVERTVGAYGVKPSRVEIDVTHEIEINFDEAQIDEAKAVMGWRVYATNAPANIMDGEAVVKCYWEEYQIEHMFNDLLNKITQLLPVRLHKDYRIVALVRLLTVVLKFTTHIQGSARKKLAQTGEYMKDLYPGNPGRKTNKPSVMMLLEAFSGVSLVILKLNDGTELIEITKLEASQLKILDLLDIPHSAYSLKSITNVKLLEI